MTFTEKLDMLMEKNHMNKSELSRISGIPYTTIDGFYKKGSDNIKLSTLKKLAKSFNCSLDYLVDDDVVDNEPQTIAAHKNTNWTQEELNKINDFKKLLLAARSNKGSDWFWLMRNFKLKMKIWIYKS